ncbi:MAG TPA: UvrD-helicase domain-containing protein [Phycisphaerae bacterium]|nr:UvrD-helicase domain-containing protein [Phycisphaerae bacterium]
MTSAADLTPAQSEVVRDLGRSWCVTSGAGCGKTRVLVERYLEFLEDDLALPMERLAAITFTENAAAEMRSRIRQACLARAADARAAGDTGRAARWLSRYWDVDVAPIHTIHGFAAAILRRFPIEAGVDPNFQTLDDPRATLLVQDVVAGTVEELLEAEDKDLLGVLEHFDLVQARKMLADLVSQKREVLRRVAGPVLARSDEEILRDLRQQMGDLVREVCAEVLADPVVADALAVLKKHSGEADDLREKIRSEMLRLVNRLARARTAEEARAAAGALTAIRLSGGSVKKWPSQSALDAVKDATKALKTAFTEALKDLPAFDAQVESQHLAVARALYHTARRVEETYTRAKRERSSLDFEDLQILARDLLASNPRVLKACRDSWRAILVDELQDTNLLQFELVDLLVSSPGKGAKPGAPGLPRAGALFGVGDPKQSIYRFRGAEIEVFERALARVGPKGRKGLDRSFRLNAGLAELVNHLFPPLMGEMYEPVEAAHEQKNESAGEWIHVAGPQGDALAADDGFAAEAQRLAERIRAIVEDGKVRVWGGKDVGWRPAQYGDVAVLLRRTTYLHLYEEALQRADVPFHVVAGRGFYKQQEVLDVLHLLRALDDPSDDLAVAGVLRSPFFSVSDEGLWRLRPLGRTLREALAAADEAPGLAEEDRRGLARAARLLARWTAEKDQMGLAALVDEAVFASGYAASAVTRFGGARAYANLRQMAELARRFEREGLGSLGDYVDYVTDFMGSEMREAQAPLETPGADTVRVMTIHKAKGLEFPVVAIPDLAYAPLMSREEYLIHPATGLAVRLRDEEGDRVTSGALALARREDNRAERAEAYRLLYVAMTRAKDYLVLASHEADHRGRRPLHLEALVQGLGADLSPGHVTAKRGSAPAEPDERLLRLPKGARLELRVVEPPREPARGGERRAGPRDVLAAGRIAHDRLRSRAEGAPRGRLDRLLAQVEPPAAPARPPGRVAATSLDLYRRCPAQYRWAHGLGVTEPEEPAVGEGGLTALERGLIVHRAMQLATLPDAETVRRAAAAAAREVGAAPDAHGLARDVARTVERFWASDLGRRVARARLAHREMPVLLAVGETEVRGQVDLVFQNADGTWEIVDYKSRLPRGPGGSPSADPYRLQLGLYAVALARWTGRPPARCTAYGLDDGAIASQDTSAAALAAVEAEAKQVLSAIGAGRFESADEERCPHCRYRRLCGR